MSFETPVQSVEEHEKTVAQLKSDEGYRQNMYQCSADKTTIGYGFNLEVGLTEDESDVLLRYKLSKLKRQLGEYKWYRLLNDARKGVAINMVYQLGLNGVLKFKNMIAAIEEGDYDKAAVEMMDSKWFDQTPNRANRLIEIMRTGEHKC